jgi:hypothetical protein
MAWNSKIVCLRKLRRKKFQERCSRILFCTYIYLKQNMLSKDAPWCLVYYAYLMLNVSLKCASYFNYVFISLCISRSLLLNKKYLSSNFPLYHKGCVRLLLRTILIWYRLVRSKQTVRAVPVPHCGPFVA